MSTTRTRLRRSRRRYMTKPSSLPDIVVFEQLLSAFCDDLLKRAAFMSRMVPHSKELDDDARAMFPELFRRTDAD